VSGDAITPTQLTNFIFFTEKIAKIPIKIVIGQEGTDTEPFGYQLRTMFTKAGFLTPADAGPLGIHREPGRVVVREIAEVGRPASMAPNQAIVIKPNEPPPNHPPWPDVIFFAHGTGNIVLLDLTTETESVGGRLRDIVRTNNTRQIYQSISQSLERCGITTGWQNSHSVGPGEFEILIPAIRH
jgi:hypothetical protein